jgi:hypothetical protein
MAQQALTAGMTVPRRRAMFGLLDAEGWGWASIKAAIWLVFIIIILGYIPDRAYYFTVGRTVDLGVLVWSPINFCPPTNGSLPCPAPVGAIVPWETSPPVLSLPEARENGAIVQVSTHLYYIGGSDGTSAKSDVFVATTTGTGNFDVWKRGPSLPAPRTDASAVYVAGKVYLIGGKDASGAPTSTTYVLTPGTNGDLGTWAEDTTNLPLTAPRYGTAAVALADGLLLIGGSDANGPVATVWKAPLDANGLLGKWTEQKPLVQPQSDVAAALAGNYVWVFGGHDATGPVGTVQRGTLGLAAAAGLPENPDEGKLVDWAINDAVNLPVARDDPAAWSVQGVLYVAGGADATGLQQELYWAIPTADGSIAEWKHLDVSDLPVAQSGGATVVNGPDATIVGGRTADGVIATSLRGNMAPQAPFFRLGLAGMTVPGLTIQGEIGQQLGYLNAAGAGTVDFIILILIGVAFAHKERTRQLLSRIFRRH